MEDTQNQSVLPYPPKHNYVMVSVPLFIPKNNKKLTATEFKVSLAVYHYYRKGYPMIINYLYPVAGVSRKGTGKAIKDLEAIGYMSAIKDKKVSLQPKQYVKLPLAVLASMNGLTCKVYCFIAHNIWKDGYDFAADRIAPDLRCHQRSVETSLNTLIKAKLLQRVRVGDSNSNSTKDARRVTYSLFCPVTTGNSIFDKAKRGELYESHDCYLFQIFLQRHDFYWKQNPHKPLKNKTIIHYCRRFHYALSEYGETVTYENYKYYAMLFFESTKTDCHFPVFIHYLTDRFGLGEILFDAEGNASGNINHVHINKKDCLGESFL